MSSQNSFSGSCHCGNIKYQLKLPESLLADPKAGRCNCTWCQKPFFTGLKIATPSENFTLLSPADKGELGDYMSPTYDKMHRYFCKKCGTHVWREGGYELQGQWIDHFAVNLCTIDQPQEGIDLSKFKIDYVDGRNDNWMVGTKSEPWSGGCY